MLQNMHGKIVKYKIFKYFLISYKKNHIKFDHGNLKFEKVLKMLFFSLLYFLRCIFKRERTLTLRYIHEFHLLLRC